MMQALRQFHKPTNGLLTIQLPAGFTDGEVEVIILPKATTINGIHHAENEMEQAVRHFLTMDTSNFTDDQLQAYRQNCERLQAYQPGGPPLYDLYKGMVHLSDDYDAPLPDEIIDLFYGCETDEYGMTLQP